MLPFEAWRRNPPDDVRQRGMMDMVKPKYDLTRKANTPPGDNIEEALEQIAALTCTHDVELDDPMAAAVEAYRILREALAKFPPPVSD